MMIEMRINAIANKISGSVYVDICRDASTVADWGMLKGICTLLRLFYAFSAL
jgi:hypothetical protein